MSYIAHGVTATGERVPLTVTAETGATGLVVPSVHLDGQAFDRVVVDVVPDALPAESALRVRVVPTTPAHPDASVCPNRVDVTPVLPGTVAEYICGCWLAGRPEGVW